MREAFAAGYSPDQVRQLLSEAGWHEDEAEFALSGSRALAIPTPVPRRRPSGSARDAFLYLITFSALYIFSVAFGEVLFGLVDRFQPDRVQDPYGGGQGSELRWAIAAIVVGFPTFLYLTAKHFREYKNNPERRNSPARKWLTYLMLTVTTLILFGTLIDLVGNVLGGELALRFFLKVAVVLVIAGSIFLFYLWELRWKDRDTAR